METWIIAAALGGGFVIGGLVAFLARRALATRRIRAAEREAEALLADARTKHKEALLEAKEEAIKILSLIHI